MKKKYWLTLFSSVFIWKKHKECYVYNSDNFKGKLFSIDNSELELFIDKLIDFDNLYCISMTHSDLENEVIYSFVIDLISMEMAKITNQENLQIKPIQLPPFLNLQSDIERLRGGEITDLTIGEDVLSNLYLIQIELSEKADIHFMNGLGVVLDSLERSFVNKMVISGYKPLLNQFDYFWKCVRNFHGIKTFVFILSESSKDLIDSLNLLIGSDLQIKLIVYPGYTVEGLNDIREKIDSLSIPVFYEFYVFEEQDCIDIEEITDRLDSDAVCITPCVNSTNLEFFEKYVYIDEEAIQNSCQTKKNVFAHQALNTKDFGKLIFALNGKVYANIHHQPLGTLYDDIKWLVYKEMNEGKSWHRIRNMKPCSDCVYQWLCPSPSDYELEIGKPNLCFKE